MEKELKSWKYIFMYNVSAEVTKNMVVAWNTKFKSEFC